MGRISRQIKRENQKKQENRQRFLVFGGLILGTILIIVIVVLSANKSSNPGGLLGDEVAITSRAHVPTDTIPGPYTSNPPAGGSHYDTDFPAKFYQEADLATLPANPQGYLVHNLEHGYVIFWYNCQAPNTDCSVLKKTIQQVMDETGGDKLIAFPWTAMDVPLAMTSWGRILKFQTPDPALMKQFVDRNRYQAPEPNAP